MSQELSRLFFDLDLEKLRINRPSKFIFLCGGKSSTTFPESLRDYLYRVRAFHRQIDAEIVLAEKAVQIYRETSYTDLISFEEDVALISSLVLIIAESAGSLAELGAFSSNEIINKSIRIIIQDKYSTAESFIRLGPVARVINRGNRKHVGYYPWRLSETGRLVQASANSHYIEIRNFIKEHIDAISSTELFRNNVERAPFYIIYWVIFLAVAIPTQELYTYVDSIFSGISDEEKQNKLYCMQLAGWIERKAYSGKDYFFVRFSHDPFDYAFKAGVVEKDSARRKFAVAAALSKINIVPQHVKDIAHEARRGGPP